ncbi:MAG: HAD-IA family hydrolase [Acidobacteriota bacterium]|nr:HAD-IA family hydrolase [Acidobacteriota bacterium]
MPETGSHAGEAAPRSRAPRAGLSRGRISAVLLDVLGTLLELEPPAPRLREALEREHGISVRLDDVERGFAAEIAHYRTHHLDGRDGAALAELRTRCARELRRGIDSRALDVLDDAELRAAMLDALRFRPYPDAAPALAQIHELGIRAVAVSNWDVALPDALRAAGLDRALDGVISSATVGRAKPDPVIFERALAVAGASATEAVHVGDSVREDVRGALDAGLGAVLLSRGEKPTAPRWQPASAERGAGPSVERADEAGGSALPAGVPVVRSLSELGPLLRASSTADPAQLR